MTDALTAEERATHEWIRDHVHDHAYAHGLADDVFALRAEVEALREALRKADAEASVAHDAIWNKAVAPNGLLHDNDNPASAQSAIWRLHEIARAALREASSGAANKPGEADAPTTQLGHPAAPDSTAGVTREAMIAPLGLTGTGRERPGVGGVRRGAGREAA